MFLFKHYIIFKRLQLAFLHLANMCLYDDIIIHDIILTDFDFMR